MKFNEFTLYTLLCIFSLLINTFDLIPGFYRISSGLLIMWSWFYMYKCNNHYVTNLYIKGLNFIYIVIAIYGIILIFSDVVMYKNNGFKVPNYAYFVQYSMSILPIYAFYYFTRKGYINTGTVKKLFFVFLICYIIVFFKQFLTGNLDNVLEQRTNNHGYYFVPLISLLFLVKIRKNEKTILLALIFLFILFSAKRGAILVGGIAVVIYYFYYSKQKLSVSNLLITTTTFVCFYFFTEYLMDNSLAFQAKLDKTLEGNSSGRDEIYAYYFDYYLNQNNSKLLLLGNGADSTMRLFGFHAHNDWLEFLLNQGFLGIISYFIYWILFICNGVKIRMADVRIAAITLFVSYLLISFFSMSINSMEIAATFGIGYVFAIRDMEKNKY